MFADGREVHAKPASRRRGLDGLIGWPRLPRAEVRVEEQRADVGLAKRHLGVDDDS